MNEKVQEGLKVAKFKSGLSQMVSKTKNDNKSVNIPSIASMFIRNSWDLVSSISSISDLNSQATKLQAASWSGSKSEAGQSKKNRRKVNALSAQDL